MASMSPDLEREVLLNSDGHDRRAPRAPSERAVLLGLLVATVVTCTAAVTALGGRGGGRRVGLLAARSSRMTGLIQAYALRQGGRKLTQREVEAVYSRAAESHSASTRALLSVIVERGDDLQEEGQQEVRRRSGLSDACLEAVLGKMHDAMSIFAKHLVDAFFACVLAKREKSRNCEGSGGALESFMKDLVADCKAKGDYCNVTAMDLVDGTHVHESKGMCVPAGCFDEASKAVKYMNEQFSTLDWGAAASSPEEEEGERRFFQFRRVVASDHAGLSIKCG